jgi:hypothetical protein
MFSGNHHEGRALMKTDGEALPLVSMEVAGRTAQTPNGELHFVCVEFVTGGSPSGQKTWPLIAIPGEDAIRLGKQMQAWGEKLLAANAKGAAH